MKKCILILGLIGGVWGCGPGKDNGTVGGGPGPSTQRDEKLRCAGDLRQAMIHGVIPFRNNLQTAIDDIGDDISAEISRISFQQEKFTIAFKPDHKTVGALEVEKWTIKTPIITVWSAFLGSDMTVKIRYRRHNRTRGVPEFSLTQIFHLNAKTCEWTPVMTQKTEFEIIPDGLKITQSDFVPTAPEGPPQESINSILISRGSGALFYWDYPEILNKYELERKATRKWLVYGGIEKNSSAMVAELVPGEYVPHFDPITGRTVRSHRFDFRYTDGVKPVSLSFITAADGTYFSTLTSDGDEHVVVENVKKWESFNLEYLQPFNGPKSP